MQIYRAELLYLFQAILISVTMGKSVIQCGNMNCLNGIKMEDNKCKCCIDCSNFYRLQSSISCPLSKSDCGSCLCGYKPKLSFSGSLDTCVKDTAGNHKCSPKSPDDSVLLPDGTIATIIIMVAILLPVIGGGVTYWYKKVYRARRSPTTSTSDIREESGSEDPLLNNSRQPSENEDVLEAGPVIVTVESGSGTTPEIVPQQSKTEQFKQRNCTATSMSILPVMPRKDDVRLCTAVPTEGYLDNPAATLNDLSPTAPPISESSDSSQEQVVPSLFEAVTVISPTDFDSGLNTMDSIESGSSHESMQSIGNASTVPMESPPQSFSSDGSDSEPEQSYPQHGHSEQKVPVENDEQNDIYTSIELEITAHLHVNQ